MIRSIKIFSYTISDGEGNSDKAKVSVIIKAPSDRTSDQSGQGQGQGQDQDVQGTQHELDVKTANKNQADNKTSSELIQQEFHSGGTNDTDNNIR